MNAAQQLPTSALHGAAAVGLVSKGEDDPSEEVDRPQAYLGDSRSEKVATSEGGDRVYLHDIGQVHLLTAEEEKKLARRIELGRILQQVGGEHGLAEVGKAGVVDTAVGLLSRVLDGVRLLRRSLTAEAPLLKDSEGDLSASELIRIAEAGPQLAADLGALLGEPAEAVQRRLVQLEVAASLLPPPILDRMLAEFEDRPPDLRLVRASLEPYSSDLAGYFSLVRRQAQLARRHLVEANLRLVISVVQRYLGRGVPFGDLVQEGNMGLMLAVEKFDHRRGFRLSTYATWWIRQSAGRAVAGQARSVRLPVHLEALVGRLSSTASRLMQDLGREPVLAELTLAMGFVDEGTEAQVGKLALAALRGHSVRRTGEDVRGIILESGILLDLVSLPASLQEKIRRAEEKVKRLREVSQDTLSLEVPFEEGEEGSLADYIEDRDVIDPAEAATAGVLRSEVQSALQVLGPRERRLLDLRFGLSSGRPSTLDEVGRAMGLTRERVRQIEVEALRKLRQAEAVLGLRAYLD